MALARTSDLLRLPTLARPTYVAGQLLTAEDLLAEQTYHRDRARLHNRLLHGWGVVAGLDARSRKGEVIVGPGLALDAHGDEIILTTAVVLAPAAGSAGCRAQYVIVRYHETDAAPVPVPDGVQFTRRIAGATVELSHVLPRGHDGAVAVARLLWRTTGWRVDKRFRRRRVAA
ncbi:MAG: hypothetical protein U5K74_02360 [Gemmatimonadaceae bacterium]|nr:hypothetical protein [Gemmatimonadaceae bacterium]